MNYYIQGCAAKADKIKAAFENNGYSDKGFTFDVNDILFFTANNKHINVCPANGWLANIIKTHPDYKELELPVEPKFKDGDVLVTTKIRSCPFIYRKTDYNKNLAYYYVGIDGNGNLSIGWPKRTLCHFGLIADAVIAGQGQRDRLFKKMKEAGYQWDAENKELMKIKPHYDIKNFYAGMPVLVRDKDNQKWCYLLYSHYDNTYKDGLCFNAGSVEWCQCIPYNEETMHLLGTTDMPSEEYINWQLIEL